MCISLLKWFLFYLYRKNPRQSRVDNNVGDVHSKDMAGDTANKDTVEDMHNRVIMGIINRQQKQKS